MASHGGKRENAGRKSKADEQVLIERLGVLSDAAFSALESGLREKESWAVKLWFEYTYGKPTQKVDADVNLKAIIKFKDAE